MSVLIKGMKMPKSCAECDFIEYDDEYEFECWCSILRINVEEYTAERYAGCPFIEIPPHGRLIDADELIKNCEIWKETEIQDEHDAVWNRGIDACINEIKHHAPTVIESEEE